MGVPHPINNSIRGARGLRERAKIMSKMQNEILISYYILCCDPLLEIPEKCYYVVTDSKAEEILRGEYETDSDDNRMKFEWNLSILVLMSLDLDLNKVEIERSASTLGNRLIFVRY